MVLQRHDRQTVLQDVVSFAKTDVCGIVVTYNPDDSFEKNLSALRCQTGGIVIVDNGSQPECLQRLKTIAESSGVEIIFNGANLGIAAALNIGIQAADQRGFRWVLTMDQDSFPLDIMVEALIRAYSDCPFQKKIAAVGSSLCLHGIEVEEERYYRTVAWVETSHVITSGTLLPVQIYRTVGPFRNEFFMDYVDIEWCLRARVAGYRVIRSTESGMVHSLGSLRRQRFMWRKVHPTHHPAWRRYYITRNRVTVWKQYWRREPTWVFYDTRSFVKEALKILLYEGDRMSKLAAIVQGLRDAMVGLTGINQRFLPKLT
jgi:rhamnosyltransferase